MKYLIITVGISICFFLFGYCDSIRGAALPEIIDSFRITYGAGGLLMVIHFIGYCSASLIFGSLSGKLKKRLLPIIANTVILAGVLLYISVNRFLPFCLAALAIGFGLGMYEFSGNTIIADIYSQSRRGKFANLVAGMHGIGAVIAPVIFGLCVLRGNGYRVALAMIIPVLLIAILMFVILPYPKKHYLDDRPLPVSAVFKAFGRKTIWKYYALSTLYIAAEAGITTWMSVFLMEDKGFSMEKASLWLSLFFVFLTLGRFIGSFFVDALGFRKSLLGGFTFAGLCVMAGIFLPGSFTVFLPLSGLFLSVLFPTLGAAVSVECAENTQCIHGSLLCICCIWRRYWQLRCGEGRTAIRRKIRFGFYCYIYRGGDWYCVRSDACFA